jgi:hypothetical protein
MVIIVRNSPILAPQIGDRNHCLVTESQDKLYRLSVSEAVDVKHQ